MIKRRRGLGFTLIELMIVVLIIGIMASMAIPAFQRYMRRAKNTEAVTALGALNKMQIITFNEKDHFAYCETDMTGRSSQWAQGQKFPLYVDCTDNVQFPIPEGRFTHFEYSAIPGKFSNPGTLDPAIDIEAALLGPPDPPVNFETSEQMFNVLGKGGACNGFGVGVKSMTGIGLGLEAVPPSGYGYYVAFAIANLSTSGLTLAGEACSLVFQTVEYDPINASGYSASPIIIYALGD